MAVSNDERFTVTKSDHIRETIGMAVPRLAMNRHQCLGLHRLGERLEIGHAGVSGSVDVGRRRIAVLKPLLQRQPVRLRKIASPLRIAPRIIMGRAYLF